MPEAEMPDGNYFKNKVGFVVGIAFFFFFLLVPIDLDPQIRSALGVLFLCAIWWGTEAIPVYATALIPGFLMPFLDILPLDDALAQYAHNIIFLFLGGFLIAQAMIKWGLDKRIALAVLSLGRGSSDRLILYFMAVTALLSAFISNTATTAMMLPIGMAVLLNIETKHQVTYGRVLMLGVAYAASIGGVATLVGTPPNAIFAGFSESLLGKEVTFFEWLKIGLPVTFVMLPLTWQFLLKYYRPARFTLREKTSIAEEKAKLGPFSRGEQITVAVFLAVALLWITRPFWDDLSISLLSDLQGKLDDSTIAMAGGLMLFILPTNVRKWEFALTWKDARKVQFGVLLLFGGGLCLGKGLFESGAAQWIADSMPLSSAHPLLLIFIIAVIASFLTEVASNTAMANMLIPILIAVSASIDVAPYMLLIPATLACSIAFMFPIATPPNAIVYASGYVSMADMLRAGFWIHLIGVVVITLMSYFVTGLVLDVFPV
jgi:sodium-dependent dicarboxylate transporter 2/3/5